MELSKIQLELREKLIERAAELLLITEYIDYKLSNHEIAEIFGISRQAVYQILIRQRAKRIPK